MALNWLIDNLDKIIPITSLSTQVKTFNIQVGATQLGNLYNQFRFVAQQPGQPQIITILILICNKSLLQGVPLETSLHQTVNNVPLRGHTQETKRI